ncbi:unnamed protein product [Medioppia subpectinata]|uniref:Uncharacterized protein n=1 Tax=Medioppia subpectinata TaxID=1979941 RepID=A0A7R9Q074_9ACAR|nr:unnamed protein product [Medioppia subpectinata]CAG2107810.1 unnamed protein product [Medioppia subpectinata]
MSVTFNYTGKVVLVTGSSSGIGAATAVLFAKNGARVVVTGLKGSDVSNVAQECRQVSPTGQTPLEVVTDFRNESDMKLLVEQTIDKFGQLDILVNNAGVYPRFNIMDPDYVAKQRQVLDVNLISVTCLTHLCAKYLAQTKGCIVNISSCMGINTGTDLSAYCTSKSAINMFTRCMAVELGTMGIRVNAICPGIIRTQPVGSGPEEMEARMDAMGAQYPVGRCGLPIDIANTVAYLASDCATFITGAIIPVDGGCRCRNIPVGLSYNISDYVIQAMCRLYHRMTNQVTVEVVVHLRYQQLRHQQPCYLRIKLIMIQLKTLRFQLPIHGREPCSRQEIAKSVGRLELFVDRYLDRAIACESRRNASDVQALKDIRTTDVPNFFATIRLKLNATAPAVPVIIPTNTTIITGGENINATLA